MERKTKDEQIQEAKNYVISISNRLRSNVSYNTLRESNNKFSAGRAAVKKTQDELKENIKELRALELIEATNLETLNSHSADSRRKNLTSELTKIERQMEEAERELPDVTGTITHKMEIIKNLQNQATSSQQETSTSLSRIRASYGLYAKISSIKWDYSAPDGTIKGFVLKPEESRVVPYKFDKTSHSQFFITNYLWEQIGTGANLDEAATSTN